MIATYYRGYFQALNLYDKLHDYVYSEGREEIDR